MSSRETPNKQGDFSKAKRKAKRAGASSGSSRAPSHTTHETEVSQAAALPTSARQPISANIKSNTSHQYEHNGEADHDKIAAGLQLQHETYLQQKNDDAALYGMHRKPHLWFRILANAKPDYLASDKSLSDDQRLERESRMDAYWEAYDRKNGTRIREDRKRKRNQEDSASSSSKKKARALDI